MKLTIFLIFLFFQTNLGKNNHKFEHFKKLSKYNINFAKNRIKLAQLMAPKHKKIKRSMPQIQMDKNGYYKVDEYRKFLQQAYIKDRKDDVIPFKTAHIFKEHNLYHPSQQAIKRIAKKKAQKKYEQKKRFERANAWRAFKKLGMRKSFLRHIPRKRQRVLKQLKKKQKNKMDIVLKKFQDLFGSPLVKKQQRRLNELQPQNTTQQQNATQQQTKIDDKQNQAKVEPVNQQKKVEEQKKVEQKKKDIRETAYLKRKALLDELRNQYHSIKRMQNEYKHIKLKQEAAKQYEFKARKLLQVMKQIKREQRIQQIHILSNFNTRDPDFDFDFLNGETTVLQYKKIENLDYTFKTSIDNFTKYYHNFYGCLQATKNNFDWDLIDTDPHTINCRSKFAYLMMILRNIFLYAENKILKLLPRQIQIENYQINKRQFFYGMIRQKYFSSDKSIDTLTGSIDDIKSLTLKFLGQKQFISQLLEIARITDDFYDLKYFSVHIHNKNLYKFLGYTNNECVFYTEIKQLVNQFAAMEQGQIFLNEFKNQLQQQSSNRKLNNKDTLQQKQLKNDYSLNKVTKFLKNSSADYDKLIQNEKNIFNKRINRENKRKLKLINVINDVLKSNKLSQQQNNNKQKILNKLFNTSQSNELVSTKLNLQGEVDKDKKQQKSDIPLKDNNKSNQQKITEQVQKKEKIIKNDQTLKNTESLPKTI